MLTTFGVATGEFGCTTVENDVKSGVVEADVVVAVRSTLVCKVGVTGTGVLVEVVFPVVDSTAEISDGVA